MDRYYAPRCSASRCRLSSFSRIEVSPSREARIFGWPIRISCCEVVKNIGTRFKTIGFVLAMVLVGCTILATRYYEVDLPVWHFLGGGNGPDPATLHLRGEFVESNLGTAEDAAGSFTVRMIAQQYVFVPQCIAVPAGVPVRFRITSADVVHLLSFLGTNDALKALPGTITEATFTFAKPGEFTIPCHEFCGAGHYAMRGKLQVLPRDQFASLRPGERRTCEPQ